MGDLEKFIPAESPIVTAIYANYKRVGDANPYRGYLGASIIGHPCDRYLWYTFRACTKEDFPGRLYRLFETGDFEEIRLVKDLRNIGCTVHDVDPRTGKQIEILDFGGHFSGHLDAAILGIPGAEKTWHVGEFKTHKEKFYRKVVKLGVEKAFPKHFAQMQIYMHKTGMKRALYLAVLKDTDEIHAERVGYDQKFCEQRVMDRAEYIITSNSVPERITENMDWWECRFCSAHSLCWGVGDTALPVPAVNCRQCCHSTPTMDGHARWECNKHARGLSVIDQQKSCIDHLILPSLLSFAEPYDYGKDLEGNDFINFRNSDGAEWIHGRNRGTYWGLCQHTSIELHTLPIPVLGNQFLGLAKGTFGAEATGHCADDILARYPEEDSRIVWKGESSRLAEAWKLRYHDDISHLAPIAKCDGFGYQAVEFEFGDTGRVAVAYTNWKGEIREGVA